MNTDVSHDSYKVQHFFFLSIYFPFVCLCSISRALKWLFLTMLSSLIVARGGEDLLTSSLLCSWKFYYVFLIGLACFEQWWIFVDGSGMRSQWGMCLWFSDLCYCILRATSEVSIALDTRVSMSHFFFFFKVCCSF